MLFKIRKNIDFMGIRKAAMSISLALVIGSLVLLAFKGLNLGIDFTGGNLAQIEFSAPVSVGDVREALAASGQKQAVIQSYSDTGVLVRVSAYDDDVAKKTLSALRERFGELTVLRLEKVGPVVGEHLRRQAFVALAVALAGILAYITVRFRFRFAVVSVVALIHDTIITLGVFSLTGREVSLPFIAAILTIIGYSLNDTIVVLDRVRENWKGLRPRGVITVINESINQTLSRTINTSLTTFLPVLTLFIWGGPVIANFALALLIGIVVGTYSSIYIAGTMLGEWYTRSPEKA
ncbi:MAG: protein translocase subunit SecF [Thermovirgaceae bacterium]|nr:protein translocase subunit SecF [Thermovirgaceae bacterium]